MLNITFEFVGGPNDGRIVQGALGQSGDAERHFLFSNRGRVGQRFAVASDYALKALTGDEKGSGHQVQRHHYVVTERLEEGDEVWVRAQYAPEDADTTPLQSEQERAEKKPKKLNGHLLIAAPRMDDPFFSKSVVLVLDQTEDETFGLVLNRPTTDSVSQLWEEVSEVPCSNDQPLYVGGPENGPVVILHTDESAADAPIVPGVFLSLEKDSLEWIVHQDEVPQRVFLGEATWDAEQLEEEFANGDWFVLPATGPLIFADPEYQWVVAVRAFGRSFLRSIGIRGFPDDAEMN